VNSRLNRALVADLGRLARRYPAEDWQALVAWLSDDSKRREIISLLEGLSEASKRIGRSKPARTKTTVSRLLEDLKADDPQKADLLRDLRLKLLAAELLPRLSDLRAFAEVLGLQGLPSATKREQNVNYLVRMLADLPYEDIRQALLVTSGSARDLGAEYARWVKFILGRSPPD
jgi:hypothetical protein